MKTSILSLVALLICIGTISCDKKAVDPIDESTDFVWEETSPTDLGWNTSAIDDLSTFLEDNDTKSFMIMVDGKIAMESYFNGHSIDDTWKWNSAGKTLVSAAIGVATEQGLIDINNPVSDYIGTGWTSAPLVKENLITVKHLMSMTSGLDDSSQIVNKSNLTYVADAGTRWAYANVFQRLMDVIEGASGEPFEEFFDREISQKLGMNGFWNNGLIFRIYHSDTRSMAKYGQMILQNGLWEGAQLLNSSQLESSVTPSQNINESYGYFWWLNGQSSFMLPSSQNVFDGMLIPNAPTDMYAGMGADEQRLYIIPSKKMVILRMGDEAFAAENNFALSDFDELLWEKINAVIE